MARGRGHDRVILRSGCAAAKPTGGRKRSQFELINSTATGDPRGNLLTSTEQAIAATTTFTYEPTFNQVATIRDPKNNLTTIAYDAKGNPLTITDADNKVTTFTYDARGLLLTSKDALNQTTTFTYDTLGRLSTITQGTGAGARTSTLTYDSLNQLTSIQDPLTRTVGGLR